VEKVRNPRLIGRPVAVGSGVIASCCYTARRRGLSAGMSLREARRCCPEVIILAGNQPVYQAFAERVWEICHDFTPAVDTLLDDAYLDITGSQWLYGSPRRLGTLLRRRVRQATGLTVTAGVGRSRVVARLASAGAKPNGLGWVAPGEEAAFLADLPVARLPGIGRKRAAVLHKLNIHTIGALRALSLDALEQLFGAHGAALYERARGRDSQVLNPREIPRTLSRETSFHAHTTDRCEIEAMLYYLTERAMKTLRQLRLVVKTLGVKIRYSDGVFDHMSRRLTLPTQSDALAFERARFLLERLHTRRVALHGIGVTLSGLAVAGDVQYELFSEPERRFREDLYPALDAVRQKYGYRALVAGPSIDLLNRLPQDDHGFVLRTPSLTK
jgi:DNA polymerase-4